MRGAMNNPLNLVWGGYKAGKLLDKWPKTWQGEPEEPAFLCSCTTHDMADRVRMNMLEAYGVPCLCADYNALGLINRVITGTTAGGVDLYVPKSMLEDAKALCEEENNEEL